MLLVANVPLGDPVGDPAAEDDDRRRVAKHLRIAPSKVHSVLLVRKSLDARHHQPRWLGVFQVEVADEGGLLRRNQHGVREWTARDDGRYGLASTAPARSRATLRPIVV